jgi:hypothetical protein
MKPETVGNYKRTRSVAFRADQPIESAQKVKRQTKNRKSSIVRLWIRLDQLGKAVLTCVSFPSGRAVGNTEGRDRNDGAKFRRWICKEQRTHVNHIGRARLKATAQSSDMN